MRNYLTNNKVSAVDEEETAVGIFVMKRVQQISEKNQKPIMLFVDLSSAFDHVIPK